MELKDVKDLIDFDQKSVQSVKVVHGIKARATDTIAKEKQRISDETWKEVNQQVETKKAELDAKIAEDAIHNREEFAKSSSKIKETFEQNKMKWEEVLFNRCIE